MLKIGSVIALLALFAMCSVNAAPAPGVIYVSPNGNDSWSGRLSKPDATGTDGPVATLERARDAARTLAGAPVEVRIQAGTYYLDQPLALSAEDSNVSYIGEGGVTISGGRPITGFREVEIGGKRMLAADMPEVRQGTWYFSQLFISNRRRARTRLPGTGYYPIAGLIDVPKETAWNVGQEKFRFADSDIRPWKNLSDVDVVVLHFWVESRMPVKSVDPDTRTVELGKRSTFRLTGDFGWSGARYFVENVFEALPDQSGSWYLDRASGVLYYHPFIGESTHDLMAVAPALQQVVRAVGTKDKPVTGVSFRNIRFAHTQFDLPADQAGASQAAVNVPGAVYFEQAKDCSVRNCEISHVGTYAIEFAGGCSANSVERNLITDLGAGGVKMHEGSEGTTVADNRIADGGKIFMSAVGVWIGNSPHNRILHNAIYDLNYTGVSVGWRWGYGESKAFDNLIEYNHIHHVGRGVLSDLGGIYSLGISPGTKLTNNLIHDSQSAGYGGWGIYTDEGSTGIVIENNVVYHTKTGGFHQHYGKENILHNNIFALSTEQQLQRTRQEEHTSFIFERNIVYYDQGALLGSNWDNDHYKMDYNLYWDASGRPITFAGASPEDWRKRGHDQHSIFADPKFVDADHDNFTLQPDSPAFGLGFKQIDVSAVGPRYAVGAGK